MIVSGSLVDKPNEPTITDVPKHIFACRIMSTRQASRSEDSLNPDAVRERTAVKQKDRVEEDRNHHVLASATVSASSNMAFQVF